MNNRIFVGDNMCFYSKDKKKYYSYNTKTGECIEHYDPKKVAEMISLHEEYRNGLIKQQAEPIWYQSAKNVSQKDLRKLNRNGKIQTGSMAAVLGGLVTTGIGGVVAQETGNIKPGLIGMGLIGAGLLGGRYADRSDRKIFNKYNPNDKIKVYRPMSLGNSTKQDIEDDLKVSRFNIDAKIYNKYNKKDK